MNKKQSFCITLLLENYCKKNLRQKLLKWTVFAGRDKIEESPMIIPPENYCVRQRFLLKNKWKKSVVKRL
jgi:hypothetical protein